MHKELYFDFVSEDGSAAVDRITNEQSDTYFNYQYSSSDLERDRMMVAEKRFETFNEFWTTFVENKQWFCLHPLFIHPEQRPFIREKLKAVNWSSVKDEKWQDMYQRQWNKVLNGPATYYKPM